MPDGEVLEGILRAASDMPLGHVESFAKSVKAMQVFSPEASTAALSAVAGPAYRENAQRLLEVWSRWPEVSGCALALGLRSAASARAQAESNETIEVVWTGPTSRLIPMRRTREVLLDLIDLAESRLAIVSFAAYKVPEVLSSIQRAASRGVDVRLILETSEDSSGRLTHDASDAFTSLSRVASFYLWPREKRVAIAGVQGTLHAKAVIADERAAFITSANLTGHALTSNMELGILIRGGPVPPRLSAHFDELLAQGTLRRVAES